MGPMGSQNVLISISFWIRRKKKAHVIMYPDEMRHIFLLIQLLMNRFSLCNGGRAVGYGGIGLQSPNWRWRQEDQEVKV